MTALAQILVNLLEISKRQPKIVHSHLLGNGLQLHMRYYDGVIHLYISRRAVKPSAVEFATVLKNFPGAPQIAPAEQDYSGRHYLYASWKEVKPV